MLRTTRLTLILTALAVSPAAVFAQLVAQNSSTEISTVAVDGRDLGIQRDRLFLENQVRDEALRKELAAPTAELQKLKLEADLRRARTEGELSSLRAAKEEAELAAGLAQARFQQVSNTFKVQELAWNTRLAELQAKVTEREKEAEADAYVEQRPVYLKEPVLANGDLVISDRRISLNGLITMETADFVCARIDFFNNKSREFPIFIVIDDSPGGSVMAGYKILKTMQSSAAPVCVVVKSFAASMAAAICTLAPRSFAYPNAVILHHQISDGSRGNLTTQRESVQRLGEWWRRLGGPIADKMGVSIDELCRQMYAHSTSGDWQEFADAAVKLKWVDTVVGTCRETALIKNPDSGQSGNSFVATATGARTQSDGKADESKARATSALPRLNPVDCYYLYNPDGYYRAN